MSQKVFEDALARFPGSPEFSLGLALVAQSRGNARQAEDICLELLRKHPDSVPARLFLAALRLDAHDFPAAMDYSQAVLQRDPANLLALYLSAVAQFESKPDEAGRAMERLDRALIPGARFASAHLLLARFYAKNREAAKTESHLRQAVDAQPDSAQARYLLSQFHRRQGDPAKALEELQEFERARQQEKHSAGLLRQLFYGAEETDSERQGQ